MVENDVTIFFHGHDHVFAKEDVDGMVYQECPQPTDPSYGLGFGTYQNNENTVVVENSGHICVAVSTDQVTIDYIRAYINNSGTNGEIGYSYTIATSDLDGAVQVDDYHLSYNYPNPFNPSTEIEYHLEAHQNSQDNYIKIYNSKGEEIYSTKLESNRGRIKFDGSSFNSGTYYYSLVSGNRRVDTKSMVLIDPINIFV